MSIIEFLLANPLLLLFLLFFLFGNIFKKPRQQQQQNETRQRQQTNQPQQNRPSPSSTTQQPKPEIQDWRDIFFEPEVNDSKPSPTPSKSTEKIERYPSLDNDQFATANIDHLDEKKELEERYNQLSKKKEAAAERFKRHQQQLQNNQKSQSKSIDLGLNNLSGQEAMKAVVMAEIIGPPKGRKLRGSYQSIRR
ncbi:hypothetical protein BTS2_2859 [Bacillus sp. TS-2]|nr:hypothetical protein BTS2_2859 [Bacillus sp. TS-2]